MVDEPSPPPMDVENFVATSGEYCPYCTCGDLSLGDPEPSIYDVVRDVICMGCKARYEIVYQVAHYRRIET